MVNVEGLPYFLSYKTEFFSFQNNPKNLDPSYKMDLDLWGCSGRVKFVFHWTDLVICSHFIEGKIPSYSRIDAIDAVCNGIMFWLSSYNFFKLFIFSFFREG